MTTALSIGQLAQRADVGVETIRYYQRRGLLEVPVKPTGGQRRYPEELVNRLRFIKRAQGMGFTLAEIGDLLTLNELQACAETRALAARKLDLIEQKMADLAKMRAVLASLVQQCETTGEDARCPIIETLAVDGRDDGFQEASTQTQDA